ncbi:MAG: hypothetical protein IPP77_14290 [Bacteroidetes bacterium]|nr:hypothetical protein [Bacteroidota bacterium]
MMNKKIELPLRTIDLSYNELKPFHPFEEEMLERYTALHNFVKDLYGEYESVQNKYEQHSEHIDRSLSQYTRLHVQLAILEKNAAQTINRVVVNRPSIEMIAADARNFFSVMHRFNEEMQQLADESEKMYLVFTPLNTKDELFSELFDEYKEFRDRFAQKSETCSLDSDQYDQDEQAFFDSIGNMADKQEEFIETCNQVIDRYNQLIEQTEILYQRWEDYSKSVELIKLMYAMPNDMSKVCMN